MVRRFRVKKKRKKKKEIVPELVSPHDAPNEQKESVSSVKTHVRKNAFEIRAW